jgi:small conductance mechanosensitive channel
VLIKARIKTKPTKQWQVGRELKRRLKKKFGELDIEIPYPQMDLHVREAAKTLQNQALNQEALKQAIREVLEETRAGESNGSGQ